MHLALISDLHASLRALDAVLDDIDRSGIERVVCLGDIVDLGPQPCETRPGAQTTSSASSARAARDRLAAIAATARGCRAGECGWRTRRSVWITPTQESKTSEVSRVE